MFFRLLLLLVMAPLAWQAIHRYAFDFEEGYPLWPLLALSGCFWAYLQLRPRRAGEYEQVHHSVDSVLLLLFAIISSAFVLNMRGEKAWEPIWFLHLATLTFFQLLLPYLAAHRFTRAHGTITAVTALLLLGLLLKGTFGQRSKTNDRLEKEPIRQTHSYHQITERRG